RALLVAAVGRPVRLPLGELRGAQDVGDRRAELVARQVDELAFDCVGGLDLLDVLLEPLGHHVELAGQAADLVVAERRAAAAGREPGTAWPSSRTSHIVRSKSSGRACRWI